MNSDKICSSYSLVLYIPNKSNLLGGLIHRVSIEYLIPLNSVCIIGKENSLEKKSLIRSKDTQLKEDKEINLKINSIMLK